MDKILAALAREQNECLMADGEADMTIVLTTGEKITGLIESTADGVVSIRRLITGPRTALEYADIPRHYAIASVIGAYYTEGS